MAMYTQHSSRRFAASDVTYPFTQFLLLARLLSVISALLSLNLHLYALYYTHNVIFINPIKRFKTSEVDRSAVQTNK